MQQLFTADRRSMLAEINDLRQQLATAKSLNDSFERPPTPSSTLMLERLKEETAKRERHLKKQSEFPQPAVCQLINYSTNQHLSPGPCDM